MILTTMRPNLLISSKLKIHTCFLKKWLGYQCHGMITVFTVLSSIAYVPMILQAQIQYTAY